MNTPTCKDIWDAVGDDFTEIFREVDDSWRHGVYVRDIYKRESDQTYWGASYELSNDGECNGLREGTAQITQVRPVEKTTTVYEEV